MKIGFLKGLNLAALGLLSAMSASASQLGDAPRLPAEDLARLEAVLNHRASNWEARLLSSCGGMDLSFSPTDRRMEIYFRTLGGEFKHVPRVLMLSAWEEISVMALESAGVASVGGAALGAGVMALDSGFAGGEILTWSLAAGAGYVGTQSGVATGSSTIGVARAINYMALPSASMAEWSAIGRERQDCVSRVALAYARLAEYFDSYSEVFDLTQLNARADFFVSELANP